MRSATKSQNITQFIVQDLGVAIVSGKYVNIDFPTESMLCQQYGAARTIVREAVKMLNSKGLLTARPRKGTSVAPEDNWNLFDPDVMRWLLERKFSVNLLIEFTQIRLHIEPGAASLAAQRATPEERERICLSINRMLAAERGEDDPLSSDISFHVAVLQASGNRFFRQMSEMIETSLRFSIRLTNRLKGVRLASVQDHKLVCEAIMAHDPIEAERRMRDLIQRALDLIIDVREKGPLTSEEVSVPVNQHNV